MQEQATLPVEIAIGGRYLIVGLLGTGCSGATYLVREQRTGGAPGQLFVLKEVVEPKKQARHQLASQGKLLRRLHHPGLPSVRRVLKDDKNNRVFFLMEYIAGQDLETLRQQQPEQLFPWSHLMSIMAPIVEALIYLHSQKSPVIHGDIKPANIIVQKEDGRVVLADLGMMKACASVPVRDADRPRYRAPEQYSGSIDVRTDVYALGATFYILATGKLPPDACSRMASAGDPLEPVTSAALAIPLRGRMAIDRAMSLDAGRRFSSVEQFWDTLWLLEDNPAPAPGISFVREGLPAVSGSAPDRVAAQVTEKPMPEPLPSGSMLGSPAEQEDGEPTVRLPRMPKREPVADRVEEREDPHATMRLPHLPPGVHRADRAEVQKELNAENRLPEPSPVASVSFKEQEDPILVTLPPKLPGDVPSLLSFRKLGALALALALLISLAIGGSFFARTRSHLAAAPATPTPHAPSPASTSTPAPVAPGYPTLTGTYSGTIFDIGGNVSTSMSLTDFQQNQESFSGYLRLGSDMKSSGPFHGTIDASKHLQFTVTEAGRNTALFFEGEMQSATILSGDYYQCSPGPIQGDKCNRAPGGYGIWNVVWTSG